MLLAELLTMDDPLRSAILEKSDTATLERATTSRMRVSLAAAAQDAIFSGMTTADEIERVLGPQAITG